MAVRVLFGCEYCDARPDADTQRTLQGQLRDRSCGAYYDAQPGGWLIWTAGGALGRRRYACHAHRVELTDDLQRHYRALHPGVVAGGPYAQLWPDGFSALDEHELARLLTGHTDSAFSRAAVANDSPGSRRPAARRSL